jgi:NAD(P)-dependent dehydrogenase (short-subunit alcohol dehydrogenase family)
MSTVSSQRPAAVVTGVSSGIGLAIAEDLLQRGYEVFGSVRHSADAQDLVTKWGASFVPLVFDITDTNALRQSVTHVEKILGGRRLAALVNNAGIGINGPLLYQPMSEIRQMFEINVFGTLEVTRAFLPLLSRRGKGNRPGRIVNISSVSGRITAPFMGAYSASKHALEALTQGLRHELKFYGIEASAIEPGFIRSRIFEKELATKPLERYGDTDIAAWWQQFNRSAALAVSFAKSTDVVTRAVRHAIESKRPRTRYPLDMLCFVGRWFGDRVFDRLIFKLTGLDKLPRENV